MAPTHLSARGAEMSTFLEAKVVMNGEDVEIVLDNDYEDWSDGNIGSVTNSLDAWVEEGILPQLTLSRQRFTISFAHPYPGVPVERVVKAILGLIIDVHTEYRGVIISR